AVATPTPGMARPAATIPATALTAPNCMNAPILVGVGFDSGDTMRASLTNSPCADLQKPLSDWVLGTSVSRLTSGRQEKRTGEEGEKPSPAEISTRVRWYGKTPRARVRSRSQVVTEVRQRGTRICPPCARPAMTRSAPAEANAANVREYGACVTPTRRPASGSKRG